MRHMNEDNITQAVIARHAHADDARLRDLMTGLVQHLHAFTRELGLTEAELEAGLRFMAEAAEAGRDGPDQFRLLADALGLTMLVTAMNHVRPAGCTEATAAGAHHVGGLPEVAPGHALGADAPGEPCFVRGRVRSLDGQGVAGAEVEVWHADAEGRYATPGDGRSAGRGRLRCDREGRFSFRTIAPGAYPIAAGGPVVRLLEQLGRHPWRPAHLHFAITAPGHDRLVTHVFRNGDRYLDSDAVFGVRESLVT